MTYDRRQVIEGRGRRLNGRAAPDFETPRQAAVMSGRLCADPDWAVYQQMLQAAKESCDAAAKRAQDALANPLTVSHDDLMRLKIALAEALGMARAFEAAVRLPYDMKRNAQEAIASMRKAFGDAESGDG